MLGRRSALIRTARAFPGRENPNPVRRRRHRPRRYQSKQLQITCGIHLSKKRTRVSGPDLLPPIPVWRLTLMSRLFGRYSCGAQKALQLDLLMSFHHFNTRAHANVYGRSYGLLRYTLS